MKGTRNDYVPEVVTGEVPFFPLNANVAFSHQTDWIWTRPGKRFATRSISPEVAF